MVLGIQEWGEIGKKKKLIRKHVLQYQLNKEHDLTLNAETAKIINFMINRSSRSQKSTDIEEFLKVEISYQSTVLKTFPLYKLLMVQRAIASIFEKWKLVRIFRYTSGEIDSPEYMQIQIGPSIKEDCLVAATYYFESKKRERVIIDLKIEENYLSKSTNISVIGKASKIGMLTDIAQQLETTTEKYNYLKGHIITPQGKFLDVKKNVKWESLILKKKLKDTLFDNVIKTFQHAKHLEKLGLPTKRGILIYGVPGVGKTLIGKLLAEEAKNIGVTFIWITASDVDDSDAVKHIFSLGRDLSPAILFFEDLDLYASFRSSSYTDEVLGELLTQMDGFESNNGIVTIATTNHPEAIEPALKDRPSRFDIVLEIPTPDDDLRLDLFRLFGKGMIKEETLNQSLIKSTNGLTPAHIQEVVIAASRKSLIDCVPKGKINATLDTENLNESVQSMKKFNDIGFGINAK